MFYQIIKQTTKQLVEGLHQNSKKKLHGTNKVSYLLYCKGEPGSSIYYHVGCASPSHNNSFIS